MTHRRGLAVACVVLGFAAAPLLAQQPDMSQVAAGMAQNQEALQRYTWQSRVSVAVDGENKKLDLYQVRYDLDGKLQKTRIGGEEPAQKRVRGPVRKRVAKSKKKEAGEFAAAVKDQLQAYMAPQTMQKAISEAFARKEGGTIKLQAQDVIAKGDLLEFELVEATKQLMTMGITAQAGGSPLDVVTTFQRLPNGPNYPARQIINTTFEGKRLVIATENFSYVEQPGGS